jgi:Ser/Thr protein kinase RdoA (MazF antagonist)
VSPPGAVAEQLGLAGRQVTVLKENAEGNSSWLAQGPGGDRVVLRRYYLRATAADLAYEHAVLRHLAAAGWVVPEPAGDPLRHDGRWYCLTRYVPGAAVTAESPAQRRRRGGDLARLHLTLRGLGELIGQRPGWRPQHAGTTTVLDTRWETGLRELDRLSPRTADWVRAAAARTRAGLDAIGAAGLPVMVIHGDFTEWNVHYRRGRLAGVIDLGLAHQDSRPYELAIARTYRAPETAAAYRAGVAAAGWPLTELEEAAVGPVYQAFRVAAATWHLDHGAVDGRFDMPGIRRQLALSGTSPPG